jgi:hypothetical protein
LLHQRDRQGRVTSRCSVVGLLGGRGCGSLSCKGAYCRRSTRAKSSPIDPNRVWETAVKLRPVPPACAASLGTRSCTYATSSDSSISPLPFLSPFLSASSRAPVEERMAGNLNLIGVLARSCCGQNWTTCCLVQPPDCGFGTLHRLHVLDWPRGRQRGYREQPQNWLPRRFHAGEHGAIRGGGTGARGWHARPPQPTCWAWVAISSRVPNRQPRLAVKVPAHAGCLNVPLPDAPRNAPE